MKLLQDWVGVESLDLKPLREVLGRLAAPFARAIGREAAEALVAMAFAFLAVTLLQFATPAFEAWPVAAYAAGCLLLVLAGRLVWLLVGWGRWDARSGLIGAVGVGVGLLALGCLGARLEWTRAEQGGLHYGLPAQPTAYGPTAEDLGLRTADGVALQATFLDKRQAYALVLVPGWRTTRHGFSVVTLATWLSHDVAVLVIDPRGQGDSGGFKTPDGMERHDVLAAVAFLRTKGFERVAVVAEQDACHAAALAAAERGIDALALVGPTLRWGEGLGTSWDPAGLSGRLYWRVAGGLRFAGGKARGPLLELIGGAAPTPLTLVGSEYHAQAILPALQQRAGEAAGMFVWGGTARPIDWAHFAEYHEFLTQWLAMTLISKPAGTPAGGTPAVVVPSGSPAP